MVELAIHERPFSSLTSLFTAPSVVITSEMVFSKSGIEMARRKLDIGMPVSE
jgi:hypothetical protein